MSPGGRENRRSARMISGNSAAGANEMRDHDLEP